MPSVDILCPVTEEVCPALELLKTKYTANHTNPEVTAEMQQEDNRKLAIKQMEYRVRALGGAGCTGVSAEYTCPVRDSMDASPVRKGLVAALRGLRTAL